MTKPAIRFQTFSPLTITLDEYDQIKREVEARWIASDTQPGDRVLAALLVDNEHRAEELRRRKAAGEEIE